METKEKLCSKTKTKKFLACSSGERVLRKEKTFITFYSGGLRGKVLSNFEEEKLFRSLFYRPRELCRGGTGEAFGKFRVSSPGKGLKFKL